MDIYNYFEQLWFNKKETLIFSTLYKLWLQPASVIANSTWFERTYVYKVLLKFVKIGFIIESLKWWTKNFFISDLNYIKKYIVKENEKIKFLEQEFNNLEEIFEKEKIYSLWAPKIQTFEWINWLEKIYKDIFEYILQKWYISIKFFTSNINESESNTNDKIKKIWIAFFEKLKNNKINVEAYLWNGISLMENLSYTNKLENLYDLPAWNSSINIYIVWQILYIITFKEKPIWLKIDNVELWNTMHFIFENLKK